MLKHLVHKEEEIQLLWFSENQLGEPCNFVFKEIIMLCTSMYSHVLYVYWRWLCKGLWEYKTSIDDLMLSWKILTQRKCSCSSVYICWKVLHVFSTIWWKKAIKDAELTLFVNLISVHVGSTVLAGWMLIQCTTLNNQRLKHIAYWTIKTLNQYTVYMYIYLTTTTATTRNWSFF